MVLLQLFSGVHAATHFVCGLGADLIYPCDYTDVAEAINTSASGDTLLINGVLTLSSIVDINHSISLEGIGGELQPTVQLNSIGKLRIANLVTIQDLDLSMGRGTLQLTDGELTLKSVNIYGDLNQLGPLINAASSVLSLDNCHVYRRTNEVNGGLITATDTLVSIINSTLADGGAGSGGAIHLTGGILSAVDSTFKDNRAVPTAFNLGIGGAIYTSPTTDLSLSNITFTGNTADLDGGAVAAQGPASIHRSRFCGNHAQVNGGALLLRGPSDVSNVFMKNNTGNRGGAIYSSSPTSVIVQSGFLGNVNTLYTASGPTNSVFQSNTGAVLTGPSGDYNLWTGNTGAPAEPNSLYIPPRYETAINCAPPRPKPWSPLLDSGDPALVDLDGSRSDIGPHAGMLGSAVLFADDDADGKVFWTDCDDTDETIGTYGISYPDLDGDGWGIGSPFPTCSPISLEGDCDDLDETVHPAALEICGDGVDNDCDGFGGATGDDEDGDGLDVDQELALGTDVCLPDTDGDGVDDGTESPNDFDGDGLIDPLDADDDNDLVPSLFENGLNTDGDSQPDRLDADDDNDGLPTLLEDVDADGDPRNDDTDGDGIPNYLDNDDDNDGVVTSIELAVGMSPLNPDTDGDGLSDGEEFSNNRDWDLDGFPDWNDPDDDNDGIPTSLEGNGDADGDGAPNHLDFDADGNGIPDAIDGTGDNDLDGIPDFLDTWDTGPGGDADLDGLPDTIEMSIGSDLNSPDTDGDGILDVIEAPFGILPPDTDGDGTPNILDDDDDGDTVPTLAEADGDTDGDEIPDYLDDDDDNDGVPTALEDWDSSGTVLDDDRDEDGIIDYLDDDDLPLFIDTDGDGVQDQDELLVGTDPSNPDSDGDGFSDGEEFASESRDTDGDGLIDALDDDDDDDGRLTFDEAPGDYDSDGIPNHLDADSDGDGVVDGREGDDSDNDGRPDYLDSGSETSPTPSTVDIDYGFGCQTTPAPTGALLLTLVLFGARRRP